MRISLLLALLLLAAAACSSTDLAEGIANQALSDEGVTVDLNGEDGVTVDTPDGTITTDIDGDSLTVDGPDGTITAEGGEDGTFSIDTPDGTVSGGVTSELPDSFPASFPLPEGYTVTSVITSEGTQSGVVFSLMAPGSVADVSAFYEQALPSAGYEVTQSVTTPDGGSFQFTGADGQGTVAVGTSGGMTTIAGQIGFE